MEDWEELKQQYGTIKGIPDAGLDRFHADVEAKGKSIKEKDTNGKLISIRRKLRKIFIALSDEKTRRMKEDVDAFGDLS